MAKKIKFTFNHKKRIWIARYGFKKATGISFDQADKNIRKKIKKD